MAIAGGQLQSRGRDRAIEFREAEEEKIFSYPSCFSGGSPNVLTFMN